METLAYMDTTRHKKSKPKSTLKKCGGYIYGPGMGMVSAASALVFSSSSSEDCSEKDQWSYTLGGSSGNGTGCPYGCLSMKSGINFEGSGE